MPDTRIEGTVPEEAGMRSSPLESRLAALEQRANALLANLEKERQAVEEQKPEDKPATVGEVQVALDKLMQGVAMASNGLANSVNEIVEGIRNEYATQDQAKQFAKDAVPKVLQDLDAASSSPGKTLMRQSGGKGNGDSVYWGESKGGTTTTIEEVWAFGVKSILVAKATFYEGYTMKGTQLQGFVAEKDLNITAQGQIAYLSYSLLTGVATLGLSNTFPLSGSNTYVKPLQSFNLVDGIASKLFTYHKGVVQIDSAYA